MQNPESLLVLNIIGAATTSLEYNIDVYRMTAALAAQTDEDWENVLLLDLSEWDEVTADVEQADTILQMVDTVSGLSPETLREANKLRQARDTVGAYLSLLAERFDY